MTDSDKKRKSDNIHVDHRQRMKKLLLDNGLQDMPEHNVLEFLLFYCIPQKDTNPIAHRLIDHFGSLANVLDASYDDLLKVPGIGPHTAMFLATMPQVFKYYTTSKSAKQSYFGESAIYGRYAINLCIGLNKEEFYIICLNKHRYFINTVHIGSGSVDEVAVYTREVAQAALSNNAQKLILLHNHPSGRMQPSSADFSLTENLYDSLAALKIEVIDHVIVSNNTYFSFKEKGLPLSRNRKYEDIYSKSD